MNRALVQAAVAASKGVELADSDEAAAYRRKYSQEAAKAKPAASVCTTLSADTY